MAEVRDKAAVDLEWSQLLDALAGHCAGEVAAARLRAMDPATTRMEALERNRRSQAALDALALGVPVVGHAVNDCSALMALVERAGVASAEQLRDATKVLTAASALRAYARARQSDVVALAELLHSDPLLEPLCVRLRESIDEAGQISDRASPELRQARRRVQQLRKALADKLAEFARTHADVLRDGSHVERDGRYGLPLRADAHRKLDGIVLGSSSTGATLYVEPPAVTALSNKLRLAEDDVEREEARVLAELSHALGEMLDAFARAYEVCLEADLLAALSRWAQSARARCVAPDDGDDVVLRHMRHPLLVLQGAPVVANDITLSTKSALVISGPNAGGKTVALKCLGLAVWMSRSGIPIPLGEDSRIGWFGRVLTGIGDEQSIARSLSTFSAHVTNLARILRAADGRTLVLLDEIAGGTDPEEGAALAAAVLEALIERGSAVATTTHYERLKELAAQDPRFVNASVGFDFEAMLPTFELRLGIPGASSALMVAARFDMPADVVQRARAFMSEPSLAREELLARIQRDQSALHEARQAAENDARAVAELRAELESQRSIVRDKERKKLERERDSMMSEVRGARAELRALMAGARDGSDLKRAERAIDEAAKVVSVGAPIDLATRNSPVAAPVDDDAKLAKGTLVWVERLNSTAEVVDPPERGEVRVRAGAFTMRVPVSELRLATQKKRPAAQPTYHHTPTPVARAAALRTSTNTCDLRGRRVDDALTELDRFVDDLSRGAPDDAGFVLHGHGTGALKQAVRDHLAASGRIAEMRPAEQGEGGDAFTVFWLRG